VGPDVLKSVLCLFTNLFTKGRYTTLLALPKSQNLALQIHSKPHVLFLELLGVLLFLVCITFTEGQYRVFWGFDTVWFGR